MVAPEALTNGSGLLQPGALVYHLYRVAYAPGLDGPAFLDKLRADLPEGRLAHPRSWRCSLRRQPLHRPYRAVLNVLGFAALLIGGIGIANAVRAYLESRAQSLAILRCLGATSNLLFAIYGMQILVMAGIGIIIGLGIGVALPFARAIGAQRLWSSHPAGLLCAALALCGGSRPADGGLLFAAAAAAGAAYPPGAVCSAPCPWNSVPCGGSMPFRWPSSASCWQAWFCSAARIACSASGSSSPRSAPWCCSACSAIGIRKAAGALRVRAQAQAWPQAIRFALGAMVRPQAPAAGIVISLGLGLTVLVAVGLIQRGLTRDIAGNAAGAGAELLFHRHPAQRSWTVLPRTSTHYPSASGLEHVPMLRGRIVKINDTPSEQVNAPADVAWVLRGDRGITWSATCRRTAPRSSKAIGGRRITVAIP